MVSIELAMTPVVQALSYPEIVWIDKSRTIREQEIVHHSRIAKEHDVIDLLYPRPGALFLHRKDEQELMTVSKTGT